MTDAKRLPRALTPQEVQRIRIKTLPFEGEFRAAFDRPATTGIWIIWGTSGSGKTSMALMLAKELTRFGRVVYNSLEQGASLSMKQALARHELAKVKRGSFLLVSEDLETLSERMSRRQSPDFVIIDSLQYTGLDYRNYRKFKEQHRDKLIIFVSHADGLKPEGRTGVKVMYDAEMKILVEGYRAISKGRFVSQVGAYFTIWEEGASNYWMKQESENKEDKQ